MTRKAAAGQTRTLDEFMNAPEVDPDGKIARVAIVSDSLPERNGVGAYYFDLLEQLKAKGYQVTLLSPSPERRAILQFPLPGDSTQRIWVPSPLRFRRVLKALRPQSIIVATPGPYGLLGAWWARRLKAKLIFGFHTHYSGVTDLYQNRLLRTVSRFYFSVADKILFRWSDLVLANSESMVALAESLGARVVGIMGTLLPTDSLAAPSSPARGRLERIVFAGRLAPEKRVQAIVDAAKVLPEFEFTIAGDGPLKKSIESQAENLPNLKYLGWVSRQELLEEMERADLLVLPSYVESFGTVALEAMARERLALVSNACGIVDWPALVECLYRIDDDESVADALQRIATLPANELTAKAEAARDAALRLNNGSLAHWLKVLHIQEAERTDQAA